MELDEYFYGKIVKYFRRRNKISDEIRERTVFLSDIKEKLTILSRALTGLPIDIFPAEREGGYKNQNFFFPASFSLFPSYQQNQSYYLFRLLYMCVQKELKLNGYDGNEPDLGTARQKALDASPEVLKKLFQDYPASEFLYKQFEMLLRQQNSAKGKPDTSWLFGKWMRNDVEEKKPDKLENFSDKTENANEQNTAGTELKGKPVEGILHAEIDKKQQEDYVMTHNFEKVETADEHSGVWRDFDGDDELEKHQDALDELNMSWVVRVDDPAHSIYHAEFTENTGISESAGMIAEGLHFCYDEWNFSKNTYRKNYCKVYPVTQQVKDVTYYAHTLQTYAAQLQGLRKMWTSVNNKMQQQRRQTDGETFEPDALTDVFVDIHSGITPNENIYLSKRKRQKDISILLLLDISLSSDGYAAGNKVIDVEKQVAILFGEILNDMGIDFSIYGFYSKTRNYSTFVRVKDFEDDWVKAKFNIGSLKPEGYTRIGPAIRHATSILRNRESKKKWILLLSDGKPNDYDQYEGKYGIEDVKKALYELRALDMHSFALAIEAKARYYLPQMFGANHYQILSGTDALLHSMYKLLEKIRFA